MTPLLLLRLLCLVPLVTAACAEAKLPADFTTLLAAKFSLADPGSALDAWDSRLSPSPCRWPHILCSNRSVSDAPAVASLVLSNLSLAGAFPSSLCSLRSLVHLDLSFNSLTGPLLPCLAALPSLMHLDLAGNEFSGQVPGAYGAGFPSLATLSLAGNNLYGAFPGFLFNITALQELLLAYNPFAPSPLPEDVSGPTQLSQLWLAGCGLIGEIPPSIGSLSSLVNLDLSTNNLTGEIPSSIRRMDNVMQIELYSNRLTGSVPEGLGALKKLRFFDASMNRLSGEIPADVFLASRLESLHLYQNELSGRMPATLGQAPALADLRLFTNRLVGELPPEFGKNCPLEFLDLSDNRISGLIPAALCNAGKLEQLLILNNELIGPIPAELGQCRTLTRVRLPNNRLSGPVPQGLWSLPHLYLLELAGNMLSGTVDPTIAMAKNLSQLLISDNLFTGALPAQIGTLPALFELSAANNMFSGNVPASLADVSTLGRLDLRNNSLSGNLPQGVRRWQKLTQLDLADNHLTGTIPPELGELPVLNSLDLSNNELTGDVPVQLENLKLSLFNLSNNRLTGILPPLFSGSMYRDSFVGNPALCRGTCPSGRQSRTGRRGLVGPVATILTVASAILLLGVACFFYTYHRSHGRQATEPGGGDDGSRPRWVMTSFHKVGFDEDDIVGCLDEDNVVGMGAAGKVYKAVLRRGGEDVAVAVKKLWSGGGKATGSTAKESFDVEVATLGKIRHRNIVKLWCCFHSGDCRLLVYEYMPNGSLGDLLHGGKGGLLDWPARHRIMVDAAEGLAYLHHDCGPPIVHRDVKSNNILLDAQLGAKVADFGVARVIGDGPAAVTAIAGSCGYIAPGG
jgi:kinase